MVTSWAGCLCPELSPLGDILVLRLTRSSCGVYKTVIGMCDVLSLILLRFRVIVLRSRAGSRPAGVAATEYRTNSDVTIVRCIRTLIRSCHVETHADCV